MAAIDLEPRGNNAFSSRTKLERMMTDAPLHTGAHVPCAKEGPKYVGCESVIDVDMIL